MERAEGSTICSERNPSTSGGTYIKTSLQEEWAAQR